MHALITAVSAHCLHPHCLSVLCHFSLHIHLPNLSFHLRLWLGYQKKFVSFDFCDNETKRPIEKHRFLTIFCMRSPQDLFPTQLQSLEYSDHFDRSIGYNSFAVIEGTILDIRWKGKTVKRVIMPERARPAQQGQAVSARGVRELEVKSPQYVYGHRYVPFC